MGSSKLEKRQGSSYRGCPFLRGTRRAQGAVAPVGEDWMKFGPERRVRKRAEYQEIGRAGRRIATPHFVLIVSRGIAGTPSRLGITASKRVGNSVRRSRLKRLVRAAFQEMQGFVPEGTDLVVICRQDEPDLTTQTVIQEWRQAEKRVQKALTHLDSASQRKPARPTEL